MVNAVTHQVGINVVCDSSDSESKQDPCILWKKVQQNSNSYFEKLDFIGLTPAELEVVKKNAPSRETGKLDKVSNPEEAGFLFVTIKNKEFRLILEPVSGHAYGEKWKDMIMVFCTNDSSLNIRRGGGSNEINVVADEWHELLLAELQSDLILDFKKRISAVVSRNLWLWKQVQQHSEELCTRLDLVHDELLEIKSCLVSKKMSESKSLYGSYEGKFHFSLEGKSFELDIHSTFGPHEGCGSKNLIQVVCIDDNSINESMGGVTTFVNVISEQWHRLLLDGSQNAILDDLKHRISEGSSRNVRLWKQLQVHSDEMCQRLGVRNKDAEGMKSCLTKKFSVGRNREAALKGIFFLTIKDKIFQLCVRKTCGLNYGGQWKDLMYAVCVNDPSLNESTGGGTTLVNVIKEIWHRLILKNLVASVTDQDESKSPTLQASGQEPGQGQQNGVETFNRSE